METKICSKCNIEKNTKDFYVDKVQKDKLSPSCKECKRKYINKNKERVKKYQTKWRLGHKKEIKEYCIDNKEKRKKYDSIRFKNKKEELIAKHKIWYEKNKERQKEYRKENKKRIRAKQKEWINKNKHYDSIYRKKRKENDALYKFKQNIRTLISNSIRLSGYTKSSRTYEILGISYDDCLKYLFENAKLRYSNFQEQDFLNNKYNIHHIIFLSTAKTEEDILKLNYYTNLELLTVEDHKLLHSNCGK